MRWGAGEAQKINGKLLISLIGVLWIQCWVNIYSGEESTFPHTALYTMFQGD